MYTTLAPGASRFKWDFCGGGCFPSRSFFLLASLCGSLFCEFSKTSRGSCYFHYVTLKVCNLLQRNDSLHVDSVSGLWQLHRLGNFQGAPWCVSFYRPREPSRSRMASPPLAAST
uniref:Transmembrane protein jlp3 n=1 Tax=Toxoplasma gondii TaxID=5811 RepID=Q86LL6_TOXGO|nr:transmembrane protein jlp3 [Toxoplasma gondii]